MCIKILNLQKLEEIWIRKTSQDSYFLCMHTSSQRGWGVGGLVEWSMGGKVVSTHIISPQIQEGQSQDFDWTMNF